jgi:aryl-phospho-beta-D-glucosidase BglC (GH1 family)
MRSKFLTLLAAGFIFLATANEAGAELLALKAQGTKIVDTRGNTVRLRGINLGGWLVEEMWMQPFVTRPPAAAGNGAAFEEVKDNLTLWRTIEKRLGADAVGRVRTAFRNAWLDESDFDRIKAAGFNCVRLPFLAALAEEPDGLEWLDKAIAWAEKRDIYVILDMHGAPGSQSKDHHSGETGRNEFYKKSENVEKGAALWKKLAERYKGRSVVAGYDLLNEPMGSPNAATMAVVHDRLYRAIRSVDPDHLIFMEDGYKGAAAFPQPAAAGWTNVVYSFHFYGFTSKSPLDQVEKTKWAVDEAHKLQMTYGVPVYLGEFNQEPHGTRDTMNNLLQQMTRNDWAFSIWTYKIVVAGGNKSMWGYYRNPKPVDAINPFTDTEAQMIEKVAQYRTEKLEVDARVDGLFTK